MKRLRLLMIASILTLLVISTIAGALFLMPVSEHAYIAALNDKFELLKNTESPKIVIVGGSSTAFGIDSEIIDKELNYNVVNSALIGGIGLRYSLEFVKTNLQEGDIVIVVPEYIHLKGIVYKDTFNRAIVEFPHSITYLSLLEDPISLSEILLYIQKRARNFIGLSKPTKNYIYNRSGFNKYGDMVAHLDAEPRREPWELTMSYEDVDTQAIKMLNDFYDYTKNKNVQAFMTFSPLPNTSNMETSKIQDWANKLSKQIYMPIISDPDQYLFPLDYFWDSEHHLNAKGRQVRTKRLVRDIKSEIKKNHHSEINRNNY